MNSLPPLITIAGCTAVGKTDLAIGLARLLGGEIVGADSRQVYRLMDIGTAKPTAAERALVPHHLVDLIEPDEDFSLARYQELTLAAIADITARGRLPVLAGGTGQYLQALLEGWQVPPVPPQPELRAALAAEAETSGVDALYRRLAAVDAAAARTIGPTNLRRIVRALEVYQVTGRPISEQQTTSPPPYAMVTLWLDMPREELYRRIDERVDRMIDAGLVEEVRTLLERGYGWELSSMSSLGYKEFRPFFAEQESLQACIQALKWNTHAFARRQITWFKRLPEVRIIAAGPEAVDSALREIERRG